MLKTLEFKKSLKNLRSTFYREHRKLKGSGSSLMKKGKWFPYEQPKRIFHYSLSV